MSGRFLGSTGPFQIPGSVFGQITGLDISIQTAFRVNPEGYMTVNVVNCLSHVRTSQFILSPEGPLSGIVKIFEVFF